VENDPEPCVFHFKHACSGFRSSIATGSERKIMSPKAWVAPTISRSVNGPYNRTSQRNSGIVLTAFGWRFNYAILPFSGIVLGLCTVTFLPERRP
jgi:hypothetical protein